MLKFLLGTVVFSALSLISFSSQALPSKHCGAHAGMDFCFYPGDPSSQKLIYYFHGYGDNVNSWGVNSVTRSIEADWRSAGVQKPSVVNLSRGKWWYTESLHAEEYRQFISWFESSKLDFTPQRTLYGESMGAHNALRLVQDAPELFSRLALTCPAFPKYFVTDAPLGPGYGLLEFFTERIIGNSYYWSSQPDFNPLHHSLSEKGPSSITAAHIVVSDIDGYGFYDGGMALHRLLSREPQLKLSLEIQRINHCEHNTIGLAQFLAAD